MVVDRGLSPDEKIVSEGYQKLKHGQHVTWTSDDRFTSEELRGDSQPDANPGEQRPAGKSGDAAARQPAAKGGKTAQDAEAVKAGPSSTNQNE